MTEAAAAYEWGKMSGDDRRWHKVAADLDRAWAVARMTGPERRLLQYIREQTWGILRPDNARVTPCAVSTPALAALWRLCRQNVSTALSGLVRDRMVLKSGGGYLIGKDAGEWGPGRIDPRDIPYAMHGARALAARERAAAGSKSDPVLNGNRFTPRMEIDSNGESKSIQGESESIQFESKSIQGESKSIQTHYRNARPEINTSKEREDNTDRHAGGPAGGKPTIIRSQDDWGLDDEDDAGDAVVARLEPIAATLATDDEDDAPPVPLPARVVSEDERLDDRLRGWARALTLKATRNDDRAEDVDRHVSYWRSMKIARHEIAAYLAEACGPKLPKITGGNVAGFVNGVFRKRQPDWALPPVPPEWAPAVAGPAIFRASPEEREAYLRREAMQVERRQRELAARRAEDEGKAAEGRARIAALMAARAPMVAGGAR